MRERWVRVRSEDELYPGLCVEIRPFRPTGRTERVILHWTCQAEHARRSEATWVTLPAIGDGTCPHACCRFTGRSGAIEEGRLFRLAEQPGESISPLLRRQHYERIGRTW